MNASLSFRKETIQRSSNASDSLQRAMNAQGLKGGHEQRPISLTTVLTMP